MRHSTAGEQASTKDEGQEHISSRTCYGSGCDFQHGSCRPSYRQASAHARSSVTRYGRRAWGATVWKLRDNAKSILESGLASPAQMRASAWGAPSSACSKVCSCGAPMIAISRRTNRRLRCPCKWQSLADLVAEVCTCRLVSNRDPTAPALLSDRLCTFSGVATCTKLIFIANNSNLHVVWQWAPADCQGCRCAHLCP